MSRVEKHKKRREGEITVNQEPTKIDLTENPIEKKPEIKVCDIKQPHQTIRKIEKADQKELFDIEDVFDNLKRTNLAPDHDTQLEIIKEILSGQTSEYNDINFEVDEETQKIKISEVALKKLLEQREKQLKAKQKKQKKKTEKQPKVIKTRKDKNSYTDIGDNKPRFIWLYYAIIVLLFLVFFGLIFFFIF